MIFALKEEIHIIILLITYGIFIASYYDFINVLVKDIKNKITRIFVEIILWLAEIYTSYIFIYKIQDGYVPIYFIIFLLFGVIIYIIFRKQTLKFFKKIALINIKVVNKILKEIKELIYPYYLKEIIISNKKRRMIKKELDVVTEK